MKFLIDNNLSPKVPAGLFQAGHDVTHVREWGMAAAPDGLVLARARDLIATWLDVAPDSFATDPDVALPA